jgi:hypothetical protein
MSEGDALVHGAQWIRDVAGRSDEISVNPMNIQKGTVIDRLFRANEYRPPWLWSLVQLIQEVHSDIHPTNGGNGSSDQVSRLIIHPTAGGKVRGAHNCGLCDGEVVAAIERYSVSGDIQELDGLECKCKSILISQFQTDLHLHSNPSSSWISPLTEYLSIAATTSPSHNPQLCAPRTLPPAVG